MIHVCVLQGLSTMENFVKVRILTILTTISITSTFHTWPVGHMPYQLVWGCLPSCSGNPYCYSVAGYEDCSCEKFSYSEGLVHSGTSEQKPQYCIIWPIFSVMLILFYLQRDQPLNKGQKTCRQGWLLFRRFTVHSTTF